MSRPENLAQIADGIVGHGECRLTLSGSNLLLSPYDGNGLIINSTLQFIPDAGVSLAPTGLTASTLYYIYAYLNSGTMTLEASTTAYAAQAGTGVKIKNGDATRTLVGMAYTNASTAWVDSGSQRFVMSYFNRHGKVSQAAGTQTSFTNTAGFAEITTSQRAEFIVWGDENFDANLSGNIMNNTAAGGATMSLAYDSGLTLVGNSSAIGTPNANTNYGFSCTGGFSLSEGYHYITLAGVTNTSQTATTSHCNLIVNCRG